MFAWLKRKRRAYAVPDGVRVYAVGDIHGRRDLLDRLLGMIVEDNGSRPGAEIVLLGDYVDRGPASNAVLDRVSNGPPPGFRWTLLKGNHEQAMLELLTLDPPDARTATGWIANGGAETLTSYDVPAAIAYTNDPQAIAEAVRAAIPSRHVETLKGLQLSHRIGDYLFVHAGIRPGAAEDDWIERDLLWIRGPFLDCAEDHGCMVVHGHTITREVDERPNRIGIDTGAYSSGVLTALVLEGTRRRYLSTSNPSS